MTKLYYWNYGFRDAWKVLQAACKYSNLEDILLNENWQNKTLSSEFCVFKQQKANEKQKELTALMGSKQQKNFIKDPEIMMFYTDLQSDIEIKNEYFAEKKFDQSKFNLVCKNIFPSNSSLTGCWSYSELICSCYIYIIECLNSNSKEKNDFFKLTFALLFNEQYNSAILNILLLSVLFKKTKNECFKIFLKCFKHYYYNSFPFYNFNQNYNSYGLKEMYAYIYNTNYININSINTQISLNQKYFI